jgi:arylsulfatase A-like enzyme
MHGDTLYDSALHIPLVVGDPQHPVARRRVASQVRLVDVLPTILELARVAPPPDLDGRSLVPLLRGADGADRDAYAELAHPQSNLVRRVALREGGWKLILNIAPLAPGERSAELYRLADDPLERRELSAAEPARKEEMLERLETAREAIERAGRARFDGDAAAPGLLREQLRALGYAQ